MRWVDFLFGAINVVITTQYWWTLMSAIAEGVFYKKANSYEISSSFEFWAPWIEPKTLKDENVAYNSEYRKLKESTNLDSSVLRNLSAERWEKLLF